MLRVKSVGRHRKSIEPGTLHDHHVFSLESGPRDQRRSARALIGPCCQEDGAENADWKQGPPSGCPRAACKGRAVASDKCLSSLLNYPPVSHGGQDKMPAHKWRVVATQIFHNLTAATLDNLLKQRKYESIAFFHEELTPARLVETF